jgi:hypothetical protein
LYCRKRNYVLAELRTEEDQHVQMSGAGLRADERCNAER